MSLFFLEPAQRELDETIDGYNAQTLGLGDAFLLDATNALRLIERYPEAWQRISSNARRYRLARFPYGVIYTQEATDMVVIAVAHLHREPEYWNDRLLKA